MIVKLSVVLKDKHRTINVFTEFKNGSDKITEFIVDSTFISDLPNFLSNFFLKFASKFILPIVGYKIKLFFEDRVNTIDVFEVKPERSNDFLENFLHLTSDLIYDKKTKFTSDLNSKIILNDLFSKNFDIRTICVLSEKITALQKSHAVLNNFEWMTLISKYVLEKRLFCRSTRQKSVTFKNKKNNNVEDYRTFSEFFNKKIKKKK